MSGHFRIISVDDTRGAVPKPWTLIFDRPENDATITMTVPKNPVFHNHGLNKDLKKPQADRLANRILDALKDVLDAEDP